MLYENGGGVFMIPFTIMLFLVGIPMTYLEVSLGQRFRCSLVDIYKAPGLKFMGIGITQVVTQIWTSIYYIMIMVWCSIYMVQSLSPVLPWERTDYNLETKEGNNIIDRTSNYFHREVLGNTVEMGEIGGFYYPVLCSFCAVWFLIYFCMKNGIKQTGKIAYFTVISPYILLIIFFIRVCFLDGSFQGIKYVFLPDISKLFTVKIWSQAATQSLFQYSIGIGLGQTLARFRKPGSKIAQPALLIPIINYFSGI